MRYQNLGRKCILRARDLASRSVERECPTLLQSRTGIGESGLNLPTECRNDPEAHRSDQYEHDAVLDHRCTVVVGDQ